MKISDIKVNEDIPIDKKFIEIFKGVILKVLPCYLAQIKIEGIKPFSDYKPNLSTAHTHMMLKKIKSGEYPRVHVYQEGESFIMSDDYNIYYTYIELGINIIPCFVLGTKPMGKHVINEKKIEYPSELTFEILEEPKRN